MPQPKTTPTNVAPPSPNPAVSVEKPISKPEGRFLFQAYFFYRDRDPTANGTGFLVRAPGRRVAAIASAHFVNFEGSPLEVAKWVSIGDATIRYEFEKSWGMPGSASDPNDPTTDLRSDYFIMPVPEGVRVPRDWVLKLDKRPLPKVNELVWFPNKDDNAESGYHWVDGVVLQAKPTYITIELRQFVQLQSQSGSPIISSTTGRVIGTLSSGGDIDGKMYLLLCPSAAIRNAIESAQDFPALRDVVGHP